MPVGDAVQKLPTFEEQVSQFKSFTTANGEVVAGEATDEEKEAFASSAAADKSSAIASGKEVAETAEEKAVREAAEAENHTEKSAKSAENKPQKKTAEERINELTRGRRAAERALAQEQVARATLEQRIAALERGDKTPLTQQSGAATGDAPDPKKFTYGELDAEYIRALTRYETRQELAAADKSTKETQQREAASRDQRELAKQATTFIGKGAALHDDFEEIVMDGAKNGEWPLSDALGKLLLTSEQGPAIAYHLASHPDEADVVFGKTPLEQAAWLGRQEAKLSSASPGATKAKAAVKVTQAPNPPANQARGAGGNSGTSHEDTPDFSAFERQWRASIGA